MPWHRRRWSSSSVFMIVDIRIVSECVCFVPMYLLDMSPGRGRDGNGTFFSRACACVADAARVATAFRGWGSCVRRPAPSPTETSPTLIDGARRLHKPPSSPRRPRCTSPPITQTEIPSFLFALCTYTEFGVLRRRGVGGGAVCGGNLKVLCFLAAGGGVCLGSGVVLRSWRHVHSSCDQCV